MLLSIIIVNYRTKNLTEQCIKSIMDSLKIKDYEIIVVDNNSQDGSYEYLVSLESESVKIIQAPRNGGFAYGNNIGVSQAKGEYLFFINSDTILKGNLLEQMLYEFQYNSGLGALSCKTVNGEGSIIASGHGFSSVKTLFLQTLVKPYLPKKLYNYLISKSVNKNNRSRLSYCDWLCGAAILIKKGIFEESGRWNEEYFMYMEDEELCRKIKALGYKIAVYNSIGIVHFVKGSGSNSPQVLYEMMKSKLIYFKKYEKRYFKLIKLLLVKQAKQLSKNCDVKDKTRIINFISNY